MSNFRVTPDRGAPGGWKAFSFLDIPVYLEPSFFLFLVLIFFLNSGDGNNHAAVGIFCVAIFFSLLVHEFAHALSSKYFGCSAIRIALVMFGGYATHSPTTRGKSLLITLAGPAASLAFGTVAYALTAQGSALRIGPPGAMKDLLFNLERINLFWGLFNLIPIHPMDGGQALFHLLSYRLRPDQAMIRVAQISMGTAAALGIFTFYFMPDESFIPLFCVMFFFNNLQSYQALR